ncbi:MAG: hypothetical protein GF355_04740 [Candidatus Eisenbacteria bacterium]|nr:hypothetical protein [Candidatus Eisenbacteria bacterium]
MAAESPRHAGGRSGRIKTIVYAAAVAAATCLLVLILFEIGLRAAGWTRRFEVIERVEEGRPRKLDQRTLHANAVIRHTTREFDVVYRANSMGYFGEEWAPRSDGGSLRVAFFGDSFTMGHGVGTENAFPRLLEEKLQQRLDRKVDTANFGVWGSGTLDEREYIEDVLALGVDHVVLCFYINDVFDNLRYMADLRSGGDDAAREGLRAEQVSARQEFLIEAKEFLNRHSRAFGFISERTKNIRDALGLVTYPLEGIFTGRSHELVTQAASHINAIAERLARRHIPLTVVYLPARVQVSGSNAPGDFDLDLPQRLLAEHLEGCTLIDLTDEFRQAAAEDLWFREGHFNQRGHERVATWLARSLPVAQ